MGLPGRFLIIVAFAIAVVGNGVVRAMPANPSGIAGAGYRDLLNFHGTPRTATERSFNIFFDAGAWQGYSLPAAGDDGTGFSGPAGRISR